MFTMFALTYACARPGAVRAGRNLPCKGPKQGMVTFVTFATLDRVQGRLLAENFRLLAKKEWRGLALHLPV